MEQNGEILIRIYQMKTHYYEKPISQELAALIREAIRYTEERYGKCKYIFTNENDHTKPMTYSLIQGRITTAIYRENLRDDNGNYFTFGTHMYRHVYGVKLVEMHLDDWTIARLLGHKSLKNVKYYRKMSKRTVEILIKSLKVSQEVEDLLVYPIVYNARHSIELSLKIVIKMLWELERKKKISHSVEFIAERKKKLHTHNIEELYKMACENKNIDRRVPAYFENIEDMIQFYYFDEEGDAFKYELNKDDQPHMIKNQISHISIELLETEFKAVMEKFDDLIYFLGSCVDEYSLGTFTKSLSRTDIGEISKKLPVYEEWSTEKFKEVKDQIKQEYQLGSKELTDNLFFLPFLHIYIFDQSIFQFFLVYSSSCFLFYL